MSYDDDWPDQTMENRKFKIRKTIRPATLAELKQYGEKCFPVVTDPWYTRYSEFLTEHPNAKFFMADTPEGATIVYCREPSKGVWFIPGKGMGKLLPRGLQAMAEIVDASSGKS